MYRAEDVVSDSETPCQSHLLHLLRKENGSEVAESDTHLKKPRRRKRWLIDQRKKTCMLFLQADYAFYARFGSEEAAINVMTGHIQRLNEIYRQTDFNLDGTSDDIQFMIKRVKVHTKNRTVDPSYPYDGHFEVIKFLEVFSEGDYDSFCLAYLFTYRDFEGKYNGRGKFRLSDVLPGFTFTFLSFRRDPRPRLDWRFEECRRSL